MISVLIPTKNGGADLQRCLERVNAQRLNREVEIVVVDSGSTDGSRAARPSAGARVRRIAPHEFDHGATRNLAASIAKDEVLVFTSQDAYAETDEWLERLVAPLDECKAPAGVYGRQLAHNHDAVPPEQYFLDFLYGPRSGSAARRRSAWRNIYGDHALLQRERGDTQAIWERFPLRRGHDYERRPGMVPSSALGWARAALRGVTPRCGTRTTTPSALRSQRFFDSGVSASRSYLGGEIAAGSCVAALSTTVAASLPGCSAPASALDPVYVLYETVEARWGSCSVRTTTGCRRWLKPQLSALAHHWSR